MTDNEVIEELKKEVARLRAVVKELTEALKLLTEKDARAAAFVVRIEGLLSDAENSKDAAVEERDAAVDALEEERNGS